MSICPASETLVALAQARLEGAACQAAESHAAACTACGVELQRLRRLLDTVRAAPVARPSRDFLSRVRKEVAFIRRAEDEADKAEVLLRTRAWWQRPWIPTSAAAGLMAAVSVAMWVSRTEPPSPMPSPGRVPVVVEHPKPGSAAAVAAARPLQPDVPVSPDLPPSIDHLPPEPVPPDPLFVEVERPLPALPEPDFRTEEKPMESLPGGEPTPVTQPGLMPSHGPSAIIPEPTPAASGRAWLLARQNPDGGWGEAVAEQNLASVVQVSSLAVLALTEDSRLASDPALDRALGFLKGHQDPAGFLGPPCDKRTLVQAMGTAALAGLARTRPEAKEPLRKAALALLKSRGADGWSKEGATGQIHAVATAWAAGALVRAQSAGAELPKDWMPKVSRGSQRLVDHRTKTAGLFRQGDEAQTGGGWASTVAVGAALAWSGEPAEARLLAPTALNGAKAAGGLPYMEEADPETLALLALWARSDPMVLPDTAREGFRDAYARWGRKEGKDGRRWITRGGSRWDSLAGEAYATALAVWTLELAEPPGKPARRP